MKTIYQYKLLISHPSDIKDEIGIIHEIVNNYNKTQGREDGINIYAVEWSDDVYPIFNCEQKAPQELINRQIVCECDGVVAVFWIRIGSRTEKNISGTVEEISKIVDAGNDALVYFCEKKIENDKIEGEQLAKLQKFKRQCQEKGIYQTYKNVRSFKRKFEYQLFLYINDKVKPKLKGLHNSNKADNNNFINRYKQLSDRLIKLLCNKEEVVIKRIFQNSLPYEVALDFKGQLRNLNPKKKGECYKVLKSIYNNARDEFIQEQCCYYMSYLKNPDSELFLNTIINKKGSLLVKRGAYIGLLFATSNIEYLNKYIDTLMLNPLAASINAGYHQCHYGDKFPNEGFLYNSSIDCKMTINGIIRHLEFNKYSYLIPLDLYTLKYLITYNSKDILNTAQLDNIRNRLNKIRKSKNLNGSIAKAIDDYLSWIDNIFKINDDEYISCDYFIKKLPNRKTQEEITYNYVSKVYIDDDFYDVHNHNYREFSENIEKDKEKFYRLLNTILDLGIFDDKNNMSFMDIGCGYGAFINLWSTINIGKVYGIELSGQAKKLSMAIFKKDLNIRKCNAYEIEKVINRISPNIISCIDFIEHIFDIELFLYNLSNAVETNTYIIVYAPIIDEDIFDSPKEKLSTYMYLHKNHINYFTKDGLMKIFNKYGFISCKVEMIKQHKYLYIFKKK